MTKPITPNHRRQDSPHQIMAAGVILGRGCFLSTRMGETTTSQHDKEASPSPPSTSPPPQLFLYTTKLTLPTSPSLHTRASTFAALKLYSIGIKGNNQGRRRHLGLDRDGCVQQSQRRTMAMSATEMDNDTRGWIMCIVSGIGMGAPTNLED